MYEVLDVREYSKPKSGDFKQNYGTNGGSVGITSIHVTVVICLDTETNKRVRFEFYPGYKMTFLGKTSYCGYKGNYDLIVRGDIIEIKETSTYKVVRILGEAEDED